MKRCDVIVVGAGPAGVALATNLQRDGIAVTLVDGGEPESTLEGYSIRTVDRLRAVGLVHAVAALSTALPRRGSWAGRPVLGEEYLADRAIVHRALRCDAQAVGVAVESVRWTEANTRTALRDGCRLVIDARGRHGPALRGPALLALSGSFVAPGIEIGTKVGLWSEGWYWIANHGDRCQVQLVGRSRARHPAGWLETLLLERTELAAAIQRSTSPWVARPAYARFSQLADPLLAVGDAALAVDPLSGHGVYEALRSADLHASAVRTVLRGGDADLVRRYLTDRRRETWARTVSAAADFYAEPSSTSPFWRDCADAYRRLADQTSLPPVAQSSIVRRPVLDDGYIRERAVVLTPNTPRGAWRVAGIPVAELYDFLRTRPGARTALVDAARRFGHPVGAVQTAAHWLNASGLSVSGSKAS